jgi:hypothetical protein
MLGSDAGSPGIESQKHHVLEFHGRPGLLHPEWGAAEEAHDTANVEGIAVRLGDPLYFRTIIGIWKVLGAIVILIPLTAHLNEWRARTPASKSVDSLDCQSGPATFGVCR